MSKERVSSNKNFEKYTSIESYLAYEKQEKIKNEPEDDSFDLSKDIILQEAVKITNDFVKVNKELKVTFPKEIKLED
jgi:hypothetical protein